MTATPHGWVKARRHPHQVFIAAFAVLAGLPILVGNPQPGSLNATMPSWLVFVWAATLALGGAAVLAAAVVRNEVHALYLEASAHLPLALVALTYCAALVGLAWPASIAPAAIVAGFGCASAVRFVQTERSLGQLRRVIAERTDN